MIDSIDKPIEYKEEYKSVNVMPLAKALEPKIYRYHGSGQLEDIQSQVDKLTETCGRLLALLLINNKLDISQCKEILNESFEISEMKDFK